MKNLFKLLFAVLVTGVVFTSCMKDNDDYGKQEEELKKQEQAIDELLTAQKIKIEEFINKGEFFTNPQEDTVKMVYSFIDKKDTKRGIWYEYLNEPTESDYEYKVSFNGMNYQLVYPTVKLKYHAYLLDGTLVQSDEEGTTYNFNSAGAKIINNSWVYAFFPYSIKYDGKDLVINGLTKKGLQKGSKFRMVTPSVFAFGTNTNDKIPANSPLAYEFEVLEIQN